MINYDSVRMWTVHTQTHEYDKKTQKHVALKKPIETEKMHVKDEEAYGLEEVYDLMRYAIQRDPYNKIYVSYTMYEER
tara:strand:+ start:972 stop:1205 length:234 start_codon:yes stop_codon:yes gene_type:complete